MTKSRVKIAIFGLIAWALVLTLFCLCGITSTPKTPASAETIVVNGETTAFRRPSTITVDYDKHTLKGEEKSALKVHFGSITHNGDELKMLVGFTFANLKLQIKWPGAEDEYPRTDGNVVYHDTTVHFSDFSASAGFGKSENLEYLDLVSVSDGYDFYFYVPEDGASFQLYGVGNVSNELIYHPDATEPWYLTLTAAYSVNGEATENPAMVTLSRIIFTPNQAIASFELSENESYYNSGYEAGYTAGKADGYESGLTEGKAEGLTEGKAAGLAEGNRLGYDQGYDAGLAEGKKTAYDEGYAAGLAAAKAETKPDAEPDNKSDQKPSGSTTTTDKPSSSNFTSWLEKNKVILIVVGLMLVGVVVLVLLCNLSSPRRRR